MKTILLLGSNLENPILQLETAIFKISQIVPSYRASSIYKTAAWGNTNQADFYNQALEIECDFSPEELLKNILEIELSMGRQRIDKWEPRIIDIDIIAMENLVVETSPLQVPHPHMQNRLFVLIPMQELNNTWFHPIIGKSINELILECKDELSVDKISE
jgi:2-amino-4-hydroxy-6-hydroxymethyldihydropteridine diphosphokinase